MTVPAVARDTAGHRGGERRDGPKRHGSLTFAKFQSDLAKAESHSQVTQAAVSALAQDEADIDQAIDSANLGTEPRRVR